MRKLLKLYLLQLQAKNYSSSTIHQRARAVEKLICYLEQHLGITQFNLVSLEHLKTFSDWLDKENLRVNLKELTFLSLRQSLFCIRRFFIWLLANNLILSNPAKQLLLAKFKVRKEQLLTESEMASLIEQADTSTVLGLRDRALMETLYSTGIRRLEAHNLDIYDVDTREQVLIVKQGKGMKTRVLPLTQNACFWLDNYLLKSRPLLAIGLKGHKGRKKNSKKEGILSNALFLSATGARFSYAMIWDVINQYAKASNLVASPHIFRHCFASHLLKAGMSVQYLKRLLGHSCLDDTQIYLHINQSILDYSIKYLTLE